MSEAGPGGVRLRAGKPEDIPAIVKIERETFSDPWSHSAFMFATREPHAKVVVAERDGKVVGYAVAYYAADEGELANLAVADEARRVGVGALLLEDVLKRGWKSGANNIYLEVRSSNEAARRLYEGAGFREVGRRPRYYHGPVEDAVVMVCSRGC